MNSPDRIAFAPARQRLYACAIRRCPTLRPIGGLMCPHHEALIPPELLTQRDAAFAEFVASAEANAGVSEAMQKLEVVVTLERQMSRAVELAEVRHDGH